MLLEAMIMMIATSVINVLGGAAVSFFTNEPVGLGSFAAAIFWVALLTPLASMFALEELRGRIKKST